MRKVQMVTDRELEILKVLWVHGKASVREVQDESVAAYRRLLTEAPQESRGAFESSLESAEKHRSIVERFGRFPHRNRVLARVSTAEEEAWLRAGGDRMGQ